jgi:diadenosine tetraphosphate (Ap4A) HIT family hydrolase
LTAETSCFVCDLVQRRDRAEAPVWDSILRTEHWDLVHSFDASLLGWLVLIARRHTESIADLTDAEAASLGCQKTYVVQFSESEGGHVHVHVVARMPDLPDEARGPGIFRYLGRPEAERVPEAERDRLAHKLRSFLAHT